MRKIDMQPRKVSWDYVAKFVKDKVTAYMADYVSNRPWRNDNRERRDFAEYLFGMTEFWLISRERRGIVFAMSIELDKVISYYQDKLLASYAEELDRLREEFSVCVQEFLKGENHG